jgi:hypothetical protein
MFASNFQSPPRTLIASTPGGQACQYRVQHRTPSGDWHLYGSFHNRGQAQTCLTDLLARGLEARIVAMRICPVSA